MATNLENSENFKNCQNLRKTQRNVMVCGKTWKTQGNRKICDMIANKNAVHRIFHSLVARRKSLNYPGNLRGNSRNLVSQKCGHPALNCWGYQISQQTVHRITKFHSHF